VEVFLSFNFDSEGALGPNMPNKNIIIQIFQTAIGITKFSVLVTFELDWGFKLVRHRRASTSGVEINQRL
jgi:hypothetical protein